MFLLVAGHPPIRARRFRYYEHPEFAARAALPALTLRPGGPYPFRPRQHPNPWATKRSIVPPPDGQAPPPTAAPAAPKPDKPIQRAQGSERSQRAIPLAVRAHEPREPDPPGEDEVARVTIDEQLDLLVSDEELMRRRALDEHERVNHRRPPGVRHHIPL